MSVVVNRRCMRSPERGFSLLELMVTVVVVAILAAVALPNLRSLIATNRLRGHADELNAALQLARSEAVRRNARIDVCGTTTGTTCAGAGAWTRWIVLDTQPRVGGEADGVIATGIVNPAVAVTSSNSPITFRPAGTATANTTVVVCMPTTLITNNQRRLTILAGGTVNSVPFNGGGACP